MSLLTIVFLTVNSSVAHAATGGNAAGDFLAPLNVRSSEGVPINGYEVDASGGSVLDIEGQGLSFVLGGLFTIVRLLVGLAGWALEFAFRFPLFGMLAGPAQEVSDAYERVVVDSLGLKGLLLSWAFVVGLVTMVRGRVGRGLGEILLTLVIAALAASALVRPDYLLAEHGPLVRTQQAAAEVATTTVNSYDWGGKIATVGPCDNTSGSAERDCYQREAHTPVTAEQVTRPLLDSVTNALVVKPYMLLQYGRILDPGKESDRAAYQVHLKWVSGAYRPAEQSDGDDKEDPCGMLKGPAKEYCRDDGDPSTSAPDADLPELTPGGELLESRSPLVSDEDRQFAAFLKDLEEAGPVGKASAQYAKEPTWWRVGGAVLLLVAALLICALLLSSAMVLLGTQAANVGAAAFGVVTFVWGMLPGPSRQAVWKWLGLFCVSIMTLFVICMGIPALAIAMDVILTDGPELMVERLLLLDALAVVGLAFHRRLLNGVSTFGQRLVVQMRYAKVGGTHMPGDSSEIGAALAMHGGGSFTGVRSGLLVGPSGAHRAFGLRQAMLGSLTSMADGAGSPGDPSRLLSDARMQARRGLAPLALGAHGGRLALRGAHAALIGPKPPEEDPSLKLLRAIAEGGGAGSGARGQGPNGMVVNHRTGEVLHDPQTDRPLLGPRIHQHASRLRGYRVAARAAQLGYGATMGLPRNVRTARAGATQFTRDARTQLRVTANQVRNDAERWQGMAQGAMRRVDTVGQRAAVAWQVNDPAGRARALARDAAVGAALYAPPPESRDSGPAATAVRPEDPSVDARRRVLDALMQAQRASWPSDPHWVRRRDEREGSEE
ncbi:hypothetical protein ACWD01_33490 [Streptomyces sp. NPDC002835]